MAELTYAELTQGRESTCLPYRHKLTSLKVKFPFKRKVLPSQPSCNYLRQPIKLSLNFHFPMQWDCLKIWKSWHYWTYCHFCLISVYDFLKKPFPNRSTRNTYLYVNFEKHTFGLFHDYLCSQSWIIIIYFCRLSALSFIQVYWCQVSWVWNSSFRFLHVHSHIDPVNYIHVLQQVVTLLGC